jgi:hypothetical protein
MEISGLGFRLTGGKFMAALIALSTAIGTLYGGFEVYKRWVDLNEVVANYAPVSVTHIEKSILTLQAQNAQTGALVNEQIGNFRETVSTIQTDLYDMKISQKADLSRLQAIIDKQDIRNRNNTETVRSLIGAWEDRTDAKLARQTESVDLLEQKLEKMIRRALENPLAALN